MDAEIIGFDPDPEECNRLEAEFPGHRFIPLALDSESRKRHFWITENPECGSFYRPDQGMLLKGFAGHKLIGETEVVTVSLDNWIAVHRPGLVVDLLKLDTQGSELDILKGSSRVLGDTRWVLIEIEFNPLYDRQPLFCEVDLYLRQKGFAFWGFKNLNYRKGQLIWGDAYYFKPPNEGRTLELGTAIGCHP